ASCYEAQNTASRVINHASEPTGVASDCAREVNEREARRSEAAADASVPTIQARYWCSCHGRGTSQAEVFQAAKVADCARQERPTPAGDAVNWFELAKRHDVERSIVNWFTSRDLQ